MCTVSGLYHLCRLLSPFREELGPDWQVKKLSFITRSTSCSLCSHEAFTGGRDLGEDQAVGRGDDTGHNSILVNSIEGKSSLIRMDMWSWSLEYQYLEGLLRARS